MRYKREYLEERRAELTAELTAELKAKDPARFDAATNELGRVSYELNTLNAQENYNRTMTPSGTRAAREARKAELLEEQRSYAQRMYDTIAGGH